jgi:hypothetical protein
LLRYLRDFERAVTPHDARGNTGRLPDTQDVVSDVVFSSQNTWPTSETRRNLGTAGHLRPTIGRTKKRPAATLRQRALVTAHAGRLCGRSLGLLTPGCRRGALAPPRERSEFTKGVPPSPRDDFDRMEQAVPRHPPNRRPTNAEQLSCTLLGNEQVLIVAANRSNRSFDVPINQTLHQPLLGCGKRGVGSKDRLEDCATGSVHAGRS